MYLIINESRFIKSHKFLYEFVIFLSPTNINTIKTAESVPY